MDTVESTLPLNPGPENVEGVAVQVEAYNPIATDEDVRACAQTEAREATADMRTVLQQANQVARVRERAEAYTVYRAERRAADVDDLDLTAAGEYDPPNAVVGVPIEGKVPSAPLRSESSESAPGGYEVSNYDVSSYEVTEYKSIYDT